MRFSPFHERLAPLNATHRWDHWAGYLAAERYQHSATAEYFAIRTSVAAFDTSPLFKYRISGPDATSFLARVMTRDPGTCPIGRAQYTIWCDESGFVLEDGILLHTATDEYWLTAAQPNLSYLSRLTDGEEIEIVDLSDDYGLLAIQGPRSPEVVSSVAPGCEELSYFGVMTTASFDRELTVSRTGFTGDLGYELWVRRQDALSVWDDLADAGASYGLLPVGSRALQMARLDAGLLLIGVDFLSARHSWTDDQRETPFELGLDWMLDQAADRPFVGQEAIARELADQTSRWRTVGVQLDPAAYESIYNAVGVVAPKEGVYVDQVHSLYDGDFNRDPAAGYVGYLTSLMFSPVLKRHIGLAKVPSAKSQPGSEVFVELMVANRPQYLPAQVVETPFFRPERKTASPIVGTR